MIKIGSNLVDQNQVSLFQPKNHLTLLSIIYSLPNEIVILSNDILDCEGNLVLSGLQESLKITATKYRANVKRKRLPIGNTNFSIAKVEGSCLWRVWSARRGGSFQLLDSDNLKNGYYEPKFIIRAIELLD